MNIKSLSTPHLRAVFSEEDSLKNFHSLSRKFICGEPIQEFDADGNLRTLSKTEANKGIVRSILPVLDLTEETVGNPKLRKRAMAMHKYELFEVIEEDINFKVDQGYKDSEWFNQFVDYRNEALGDSLEFYTRDKTMLAVSVLSGDHHDITMQSLNEGVSHTIRTQHYGVKIGKDIDLFLTGREDYAELVDAIALAFVQKVQEIAMNAVYDAEDKLVPNSQFVKTGALSTTVKTKFDTLLSDVAAANGSPVIIMGTKVALQQIAKIGNYNSVEFSNSQKESIADTGMLGNYEGTQLVEIPQRFAIEKDANGNFKKLFKDDRLFVFATGGDKFVWFVDKGDTEILERGDAKGDYMDDFKTYEVQRELGVETVLPRYFGSWTITA